MMLEMKSIMIETCIVSFQHWSKPGVRNLTNIYRTKSNREAQRLDCLCCSSWGDRKLGLSSAPVVFGIDTAKYMAPAIKDSVQLTIVAYLLYIGEWPYALGLFCLILPQVYFAKTLFIEDPIENDVKYQGSSLPFFSIGTIVAASAIGNNPFHWARWSPAPPTWQNGELHGVAKKKRQKISKYESQILHAARAKWRAKCIKIYGEYCIGVCLLSTPCFASYFHPRTWYLPLSSKEIGETQHVGSDGTVGRTVIWNRKSKKSTDSHWGGWYSHIQSIPGWWLMPACRSHLGKSQDRFSWLRILLFHLAMSFIIYIYMRACMQTLHYVGLRGLARSTSLHVCFACLQCQRFACVNWFWLHRAVACTRPTLSLPTARGKYCLRSSRCACQAFRPYACMFACICCYLF